MAINKGGMELVDQSMISEVANIRDMISGPTGSRLSINDQGEFVGVDGRVLGNEIRVIVIDFISANRFYPKAFRPGQAEPPVCFALGKIIPKMAPHETAPEPQSDLCQTCPRNQWGSSLTGGNGKACKNSRDLVLLLADDPADDNGDPVYLTYSVAPTSLKSFDAVVRYAADVYQALPIRMVIKMSTLRQGTYWQVQFSPIEENQDYREHFALRDGVVQDLLFRLPDYSKKDAAAQRPAARPPSPRR